MAVISAIIINLTDGELAYAPPPMDDSVLC
jgi:hypothetical protein